MFLSALEYYSGVLFLTTNRVGSFDDAFKSRIHLPLYYEPLGSRQTMEIWKVNMKRLKARRGNEIGFDEEDLLEYAAELFEDDLRWNGRQIRNAFQSAAALAEHEFTRGTNAVPITLKRHHFDQVVRAVEDFEKFLTKTHGMTESGRAKLHQLRRDDWQYQQDMAAHRGSGVASYRNTQQWENTSQYRSRRESPGPSPLANRQHVGTYPGDRLRRDQMQSLTPQSQDGYADFPAGDPPQPRTRQSRRGREEDVFE